MPHANQTTQRPIFGSRFCRDEGVVASPHPPVMLPVNQDGLDGGTLHQGCHVNF
jgi:hypothetical protein